MTQTIDTTVTISPNPVSVDELLAQARQAHQAAKEQEQRELEERKRQQAERRQRELQEHAARLQTALCERFGLEVEIGPDDLPDPEPYMSVDRVHYELAPHLFIGLDHRRDKLYASVDDRRYDIEGDLDNLGRAIAAAETYAQEMQATMAEPAPESDDALPPEPSFPFADAPEHLIYNGDGGVYVALYERRVTLRAFALDPRSFASRPGDSLMLQLSPAQTERLVEVLENGGMASLGQGEFVHVDAQAVLFYRDGDVLKVALGKEKAQLVDLLKRWLTDWWPAYSKWLDAYRDAGYDPYF